MTDNITFPQLHWEAVIYTTRFTMQTIFVDISECHQYYNLASILSEGLQNCFLDLRGDDHGYYSCTGPINMHEECTEMPVMLQQALL